MSSPQFRGPTFSPFKQLKRFSMNAQLCWYCGCGQNEKNPNMNLYQFCACTPATDKINKRLAHMHCLAWHVMTTRNTVCSSCNSPYKNYRMRAIDRGTRAYGWRDTLVERTKLFGWDAPLPLILFCVNILSHIIQIYHSVNHIRKSHIYARIVGRITHETPPILDPDMKWFNVGHQCFQTLNNLYSLVLGDHKTYSNYMGHYIVFNNYTNRRNNGLVAYHITETERMVDRFGKGQENQLKQWFDQQNTKLGDVNYSEYQKFDPVPKGFFEKWWWKFKNWIWDQRFD